MLRRKCFLVVVIAAWTSCPQWTLAGAPDAGRPILGAPPGTSDVAEVLPANTDFEFSFSANPLGIRCGAVGLLLPSFMIGVLSLCGKLRNQLTCPRP